MISSTWQFYEPLVSSLLASLGSLLARTQAQAAPASDREAAPLLAREISLLVLLAPYATDGDAAGTLAGVLSPLLKRPAKMVNEKAKGDVLRVLCFLIPIATGSRWEETEKEKVFDALSRAFQGIRSRVARGALMDAFGALTGNDEGVTTEAVEVLRVLNAYDKRLDVPDDVVMVDVETLLRSLNSSYHPVEGDEGTYDFSGQAEGAGCESEEGDEKSGAHLNQL